jgi:hypothetical protein
MPERPPITTHKTTHKATLIHNEGIFCPLTIILPHIIVLL